MCEMSSNCSAAVQQCLMTSSVREAIRAIDNLAALHTGLNQSGCSHLQDFLRETLNFWHRIVKERLTRYTSTYFGWRCGMVQKCKNEQSENENLMLTIWNKFSSILFVVILKKSWPNSTGRSSILHTQWHQLPIIRRLTASWNCLSHSYLPCRLRIL